MRLFNSTQLDGLHRGGAVCIGNFDGLHCGHQDILSKARMVCPMGPVTAMTFEPHPAAILHPERMPGVLSPLPIKIKLLEEAGVNQLVVITDSLPLLNLSPKEFVDDFLIKAVGPVAVVEGPNFNFGYGRSGNVELLRQFGKSRGFEVYEVPYRSIQLGTDRRSVICSSSLVRELLEKGDVSGASKILGKNYRLVGKTVSGRGVGRQIGFPTANISPEKQVIPSEGVYAGYVVIGDSIEMVSVGGTRRPAAFSLGRAKTFLSDHPLLIEAHILEPQVEDLYGKYLAMEFIARVRGQRRFESRDSLIEQIRMDCDNVREILGL